MNEEIIHGYAKTWVSLSSRSLLLVSVLVLLSHVHRIVYLYEIGFKQELYFSQYYSIQL